ncbi:hypothetical protein [Streptomyces sp. GbtcB7]|uniref:hypothetical protein n=1 Tax=Streptomyces sp. GbtcB7 TaxID=2824752 RepID=UPI001C301EEF|nr:hypothetical protein [Streptomyces sp. GbtcB7]
MLAELGKNLAERWLSLLVLPGTLYLAVAASARALGQGHPFDLQRLTSQITEWANAPAADTAGGQVVLLAAVLAGAAALGLVAQALGSLVEQLHLAVDWRAWPAGARRLSHRATAWRQTRWGTAAEDWHRHRDEAAVARASGSRVDPAARYAARAAMTRISPERPDRPTWSGDRIHAVAVRLERDYHLDLAALWPHLWLILPDTTRTEIIAARQALTRATTLTAWALLYLPLAAWWWPATAITAVLAFTSWRRTRTAADTYATLLEAAARLHTRDLADHLGLDPVGPLTHESGDNLTRHLTTSPPPRPPDDTPVIGT